LRLTLLLHFTFEVLHFAVLLQHSNPPQISPTLSGKHAPVLFQTRPFSLYLGV
jgi:hypothetical protein